MEVDKIYKDALLAIVGSSVNSSEALELIDIALVALQKAEEVEKKNGLQNKSKN